MNNEQRATSEDFGGLTFGHRGGRMARIDRAYGPAPGIIGASDFNTLEQIIGAAAPSYNAPIGLAL